MREHACAHHGALTPQVLRACTGSRGGSSGSNSSSSGGSSGSSNSSSSNSSSDSSNSGGGGGGGSQEQTLSRAPSRAPVRSLLRSVPVVDDSTAAVLRWRPARRAGSSSEGPPDTAPSATLPRAIKVQLRFVLCGAAKLFAFTAWKGVPPVEGPVEGAVEGAVEGPPVGASIFGHGAQVANWTATAQAAVTATAQAEVTATAQAEASAAAALGLVTPSAPSSSNASSKPLPTALPTTALPTTAPSSNASSKPLPTALHASAHHGASLAASSKPLPTALHAVAEERNLPTTTLWEIAGDRTLRAAQRWSDRAAEMAAHATYYGRCDVDVAPMHWQRKMASQIGIMSNPQASLAICPAKQVMSC